MKTKHAIQLAILAAGLLGYLSGRFGTEPTVVTVIKEVPASCPMPPSMPTEDKASEQGSKTAASQPTHLKAKRWLLGMGAGIGRTGLTLSKTRVAMEPGFAIGGYVGYRVIDSAGIFVFASSAGTYLGGIFCDF